MKRHPLPQNIMDVEFKLFGAFTLRQFGFLAGAVIMALIVYFLPPIVPPIVKWPIISLFVILGLALAMMKVNGIEFSTWLANFLTALTTSQRRVWKKSPKAPEYLRGSYQANKKYTTHLVSKSKKKYEPVMPLLKKEVKDQAKVVDKEEEDSLTNLDMHLEQNYEQKEFEKRDTFRPAKRLQTENKPPVVNKDEVSGLAMNSNLNDPSIESYQTGENTKATVRMQNHQRVNTPLDLDLDTEEDDSSVLQDELPPVEEEVQIQNSEEKEAKKPQELTKRDFEKNVGQAMDKDEIKQQNDSQKSESQTIEKEEPKETQVREEPQPQPEITHKQNTSEPQIKVDAEKSDQISELENKIKLLEQQLQNLQSEDKDVEEQKNVVDKIDKIYDEIKKERNTPTEQPQEPTKPHGEIHLQKAAIQRPNIISGIVVDKNHNPIPEVSIEIKDQNGFPLRKMKTDEKGTFVLPTPLPNGQYILDFEKPGRQFTDYKINLNGKILPMVEYTEL